MIWPGRSLGTALLVPTLLSLALLVSEAIRPAVIALDVMVGAVALADLATWSAPARFRVERRCGSVGSLGEPQEVELTIENLGRAGRRMRVRDDVPETFTAEPPEFVASVPAHSRAALISAIVPRSAGRTPCERVDALIPSRLGFWQRSVSLAGGDPVPGLSRHPPDRPLHRAGPPRQAERPGRAALAAAGDRQRVRDGSATTPRGTSPGTWTGGPPPGDGS